MYDLLRKEYFENRLPVLSALRYGTFEEMSKAKLDAEKSYVKAVNCIKVEFYLEKE